MGLTVVAEGVETADQDAAAARDGLPVVQGYLYGRPVPAADVLLPHPAPLPGPANEALPAGAQAGAISSLRP